MVEGYNPSRVKHEEEEEEEEEEELIKRSLKNQGKKKTARERPPCY